MGGSILRGAGAALAGLALFCVGGAPVAGQGTDRFSLVEEARFLAMDTAETPLHEVTQLLPGPEGRTYAAFDQLRTIRVFTAEGMLETAFGEPGAGPGELGVLGQMSWRGDTLVVLDPMFRRVVYFGPDGTPRGDLQFPRPDPRARGPQPVFPDRVLEDGALLYLERVPGVTPEDPPAGMVVLHASGISSVPDTVLRIPPGGETSTVSIRRGEARAGWDNPYVHTPLHAVAPDGSRIVVVERPLAPGAGAGAFWVTQLTAAGDTLFRRRYTYAPQAVDVDGTLLALARAFQPLLGGTVDELVPLVAAAVALPPFEPPVTGVHMGPDGTIWLREWRVPGLPHGYRVLDGAGERLGVVDLPAGVAFITGTAGFLWANVVESGGNHVVRYRLTRD